MKPLARVGSDAPRWHALSAADVLGRLESGSRGLSSDEVLRRRARFGPNALPEKGRTPLLLVFLRQFKSPLIYLLFVAAAVTYLLGERGDALVILGVVVLNAVIGTAQEGRAERAMEGLRRLSGLKVHALREGEAQVLEARDLVPGDILVLGAGDAVGADARVLETAAFAVSEAALTGESLPVTKQVEPSPPDAGLGDRTTMVYAGTHVTAGRARAAVVTTGLNTEIGKIAVLTQATVEPRTPLERRIEQFGRYLVVGAIALFAVVLVTGLARGLDFSAILIVAISQLVSLVPEGLPVAVTIALAVGMQRMAARGAIVRRLAAVEALGSTTVICTDKTGTLTANEMTVTALYLPGKRSIEVSGVGYTPEGRLGENGRDLVLEDDGPLRELLEAAALCNDASLQAPSSTGSGSEARWQALGDPTEAALLVVAAKAGIDVARLRAVNPRQAELPFSAATKLMATMHRLPGGDRRVLVKGAPEAVLDLCSTWRRNDRVEPLGAAGREEFVAAQEALASQALRVLAVAVVVEDQSESTLTVAGLGGRATLLGLIGQFDPPREEARSAVAECRAAGIRTVMVTGDHKSTGLAVARPLGIARDGDIALDGRELEALSAEDLRRDLGRVSVFARVHPAQKLRIVEALQASGEVVAMTGDGVNDAPALASADVGVAMGRTGTEVAKEAAKIVITDDNFATIVAAVEQGRVVYRNLKKVILLLLSTGMAELLVLILALLFGYPLPFAAVQILWNNVVTEATIALNLIMEPAEGDEMRRPPIPRAEAILTRSMLGRMLLMSGAITASTLGFFAFRLWQGVPIAQARTATFTLLAVCEWFNVLNCRSDTRSALRLDLVRNPWLIGGLVVSNGLQVLVVFHPALNRVFHTVPLPLSEVFLIGAVGSLVLWSEELRKLFARRRQVPRPASST